MSPSQLLNKQPFRDNQPLLWAMTSHRLQRRLSFCRMLRSIPVRARGAYVYAPCHIPNRIQWSKYRTLRFFIIMVLDRLIVAYVQVSASSCQFHT